MINNLYELLCSLGWLINANWVDHGKWYTFRGIKCMEAKGITTKILSQVCLSLNFLSLDPIYELLPSLGICCLLTSDIWILSRKPFRLIKASFAVCSWRECFVFCHEDIPIGLVSTSTLVCHNGKKNIFYWLHIKLQLRFGGYTKFLLRNNRTHRSTKISWYHLLMVHLNSFSPTTWTTPLETPWTHIDRNDNKRSWENLKSGTKIWQG